MDYDWIFRNELDAWREEGLYVDRVAWGDGQPDTWVEPTAQSYGLHDASPLVQLVSSMGRLGLLTERSLHVCEQAWKRQELVHVRDFSPGAPPPTRWEVARERNWQVLRGLSEAGVIEDAASEADVAEALEQWTFPLGRIDLSMKEVNIEALRQTQRDSLGYME